jgi:hypothetical protein
MLLRRVWQGWKAFGQFMGNWVARLALTVFYFTILVPFGVGTTLWADRLGIKTVPQQFWQTRETPVEQLPAARKQG